MKASIGVTSRRKERVKLRFYVF